MPASDSLNESDETSPGRPAVVPRAFHNGGTARISVEEQILDIYKARKTGIVYLTAPLGGGKSSAIRYLKAVLPAELKIRCFDVGEVAKACDVAPIRLVVLAVKSAKHAAEIHVKYLEQTKGAKEDAFDILEICRWTNDDCLEYLAVLYRGQCASVMQRLAKDKRLGVMGGTPELLGLVMDQMAADPTINDSFEALCGLIRDLKLPKDLVDRMMTDWTNTIDEKNENEPTAGAKAAGKYGSIFKRWWRHEQINKAFRAVMIVDRLERGGVGPFQLRSMVGAPLVEWIAVAIRGHRATVKYLENLVRENPRDDRVPMAASILLALDPEWRPPELQWLNLKSASLRGAKWSGVNLEYADLSGAFLIGANLDEADLTCAKFTMAHLDQASLRHAKLDKTDFERASLKAANLQHVVGEEATFAGALLNHADLSGAALTVATFTGAGLGNAVFHQARLRGAVMIRTGLNDTDFSEEDLDLSHLTDLHMYSSKWKGATFRKAKVLRCHLEHLVLPDADFSGADLTGSYLTMSRMPRGKFVGANLQFTGLAEIIWESADLSNADLRQASFHMDASRSGLVPSGVPGEGSKTGFYTDDYVDRNLSSQEIRKASFRGSDLRGAKVEPTNFYLVDLRDAIFGKELARWFARCGAILSM